MFINSRVPLKRGPIYQHIAYIIAGTGAKYQSGAGPIKDTIYLALTGVRFVNIFLGN